MININLEDLIIVLEKEIGEMDFTEPLYQHFKEIREDGPAIEYSYGTKYWWLNGKQLTEEEFNNMNDCDRKVVGIDGKKYKLIKE